jgi:hypothetical protein
MVATAGTPIGLNGPLCCDDMHGQITFVCKDGHPDPEGCPDALFGSVRDQWFDALDRLGLDPGDEALPRPYEDERWLTLSTEG